ncbi:MAG: S-methyl-5-thioribose-1-phosphate isomerase [Anaerolineales bacterium]
MRTVEWDDDRAQVRMIDQRLLPAEFKLVSYDDYHQVAQAITDMVVRGAPAIGATAAFGLALAAQQSEAEDIKALRSDLKHAAEVLHAARPTAVNLSWALKRMLNLAGETQGSADDLRQALLEEAQRIADEDVAINKRMARNGAELIDDGDTIIHHCNTGALATVDWGTALGVIRMAAKQGKHIHVLVDETRPRLANKIGTYMLALAAKDNDVPAYSVVPTSTIDMSLATGDLIPIEERNAREVLALQIDGKSVAPQGAAARNPAFDVTPHRLLTGIVTELGVVYPPFKENLASLLQGEETGRE